MFDRRLSGSDAYCYSPQPPLFSSRMNCNLSAFKIHTIKHYSLMDPGWVLLLGKHVEEAGREAQCQGCGEQPSPRHGFTGGADAEALGPGPGVAPLQGCSEEGSPRHGSRGEVGAKT